MAALAIYRQHLRRFVAVGCTLLSLAVNAYAYDSNAGAGPNWRPSALPARLTTNVSVKVLEVTNALVYTEGDEERLLELALHAPKTEATAVLRHYVDCYEAKNLVTGQAWGRAVYSLGLVQTVEAKEALLRLWVRHDQRLQKQRAPMELEDMRRSVPPLRVIGDALHFYLWDESMRKWFLDNVVEAEGMSSVEDHRSPSYWRKWDRLQLLVYLYRWDLIDSVDGSPIREDQTILALAPFRCTSVTNIDLSAQRLLGLIETLPPLRIDMTEDEWRRERGSPRVCRLDSTAMLLGPPLSVRVYEKYLRRTDMGLDEGVRCRLWLTVLWTYCSSLTGTKMGDWDPDAEGRALLADGLSYVETLPTGQVRKVACETLWGLACYAKDSNPPVEIAKIRSFAAGALDSATRTNAMLFIQRTAAVGGKKR